MEPGVVLPPRRFAAGNFDRTKARPAQAKAIGVGRTGPPHERVGVVAESRQHSAQQSGGLARRRRAADAARGRVEAHVLVGAREDGGRQKRALRDLNRKETSREPQYVSGLEQRFGTGTRIEWRHLRSHSETDSNTSGNRPAPGRKWTPVPTRNTIAVLIARTLEFNDLVKTRVPSGFRFRAARRSRRLCGFGGRHRRRGRRPRRPGSR